MVGIFSAGYFADKFGRRGALQFCHVFAIFAAIFFGIARPSCCFEFVIVGRLVVGFSAGKRRYYGAWMSNIVRPFDFGQGYLISRENA